MGDLDVCHRPPGIRSRSFNFRQQWSEIGWGGPGGEEAVTEPAGSPCRHFAVAADDHRQFEFLVLEGAQAGLSWATILKKRENYRRALDGFDPETIARYGKRDINRLMKENNRGQTTISGDARPEIGRVWCRERV